MHFSTTATFLLGKVPGMDIDPSTSLVGGSRGKCGLGIMTIFRKFVKVGDEYKVSDSYFGFDTNDKAGSMFDLMGNTEVLTSVVSSTLSAFSGIFAKAGVDKTLLKSPINSHVFYFEINPQRISMETISSVSVQPSLNYEESASSFKNEIQKLPSNSFTRVRNRWYRIPRSPVNRYLTISGLTGLLPVRNKMIKNSTTFLGLENFVELRIFLEKYYKYLDIDLQNNSYTYNLDVSKSVDFFTVREHYLLWFNELTNEYYVVEIENENITIGVPRKTFFEYNIRFRILGEFNILSEILGFLGLSRLENLLVTTAQSISSSMLYLNKLSNTKNLLKKYG